MVQAHKPTVILITTPPIDEYQTEAADSLKGIKGKTRTAEHTKKYADACRQVGKETGVMVLDLWTAMMTKAGWKPGEKLEGSKAVPINLILGDMLRDGSFR